MRRTIVFGSLTAAVALAAAIAWLGWDHAPREANYRLARVERGDIVAVVNATGTINPTTTVIVGSQLSGQVVELMVDFNSEVSAGQVIARLNSDQIRARLDAARADLLQAQATKAVQEAQIDRVNAESQRAAALLGDAEAQLARHKALLTEAEANYTRQSNLRAHGYGVTAEATYENARTQRDAQLAAVKSADAQIASARAQIVGNEAERKIALAQIETAAAQIAQRQAVVRQIEVDLRNTEIKSPVSGVVVQRNVELGQTVAASFQSPTLFLIADDLQRMEIAANIDEGDVGRVKEGQAVSFTVNAYSGRTFHGTVKQVRLGSQTVQNVVIYTAVISVENTRRALMPGMTATLQIESERRENVLRVPNAALRWRPSSATLAPITTGAADGPADSSPEQRREGASGGTGRATPRTGGATGRVFVPDAAGDPKAVPLRVGASDGVMTEIVGGSLQAGAEVITGGGPRKTDNNSPQTFGPRFGL